MIKLFFVKIIFLYYCIRAYSFSVGWGYYRLMCEIQKYPELYYSHIDHCQKLLNKYILINDQESQKNIQQYIDGMEKSVKPIVEKILQTRAVNETS